jgi:alkanesulfonate monooxygenase
VAVHIIAGGSDADQAKNGDWTDHDARYRRAGEYMSLLRRSWTEPAPLTHEGEFYRTRGTYSDRPAVPDYAYAGGGVKPPISAASSRANSIVDWSSPSGPMI